MDAETRKTLLAPLLAPLSTDEFFNTYWEQEVLHIERTGRDRYTQLINIADIETMLSTQRLTLSDAQLSGGNSSSTGQEYLGAEGQIVASRLLQGHREGASIVLSQVDRRLPALAAFCRDVQAGLAMRCQTNAYLSPAGQQGFRPHYDSHDVFILQVQGRKIFHFYAGGPELPANHHRFDAEQHKPGQRETSVELSAGDALYIPRGVMHDAVAHPDTASLHITLGLFPLTTMDVVQQLLQTAETEDRQLRQSLPGAANTGDDAMAQQLIKQALTALIDDARIREAISALRDDMAATTPVDCSDALSGLMSDTPLGADTQVKARLSRWHDAEEDGERVTLRCAGLVLDFEGTRATAIKHLAAGEAVRLADLGDEQGRLTRLLLQHGVIYPSV